LWCLDDSCRKKDGTANKPEDKAHKAATKIQASFRGHITRKKMKDGEEEKEGKLFSRLLGRHHRKQLLVESWGFKDTWQGSTIHWLTKRHGSILD
uniref:Neuromodulin n=1 Tax=Labrus bergylta TaxID=56723 RepID=A0A3Q3LSU0_9LABR